MKLKLTLLFIFSTVIAFAQPPAGYYNTATGTGFTLKTQLYNIIKDHNDQGYNMIDTFFPIADLDIYYENDNTILDVYSERPSAQDPYNYQVANACGNYDSEGDCYNKEHVIPQSFFSSNSPMRGDAHHLLPTDGRVNGLRGNLPYGIVGSNLISQSGISNPTLNGSKAGNGVNTGIASGFSGVVFEPINEFKGDIARIYFYFVTRYENLVANWSSYAMFDGSSNKVIADPFLAILYEWHINDPVSQKEINRNNDIFQYQGNRNPFIDNPQWVQNIWGNFLSTPSFYETISVNIYPNPTYTKEVIIESENDIDEINLFNLNGQLILKVQKPNRINNQYRLENLTSGFYFLNINLKNESITKKLMVN